MMVRSRHIARIALLLQAAAIGGLAVDAAAQSGQQSAPAVASSTRDRAQDRPPGDAVVPKLRRIHPEKAAREAKQKAKDAAKKAGPAPAGKVAKTPIATPKAK